MVAPDITPPTSLPSFWGFQRNTFNIVMIKCLKTTEMSVQPFIVVISPRICVCKYSYFLLIISGIRYCFCTAWIQSNQRCMQCFHGANFTKPQCVKSARTFCVYWCKPKSWPFSKSQFQRTKLLVQMLHQMFCNLIWYYKIGSCRHTLLNGGWSSNWQLL